MGSVTKLDRIHVRITTELNEKFKAICEQNSINGSALIRKWIEEFVEEYEKPPVSMDILDIVWKINKGEERSIWSSCVNVADRLGYNGAPEQLFDDVTVLLIERAKSAENFKDVEGIKSGAVMVGNENIEFTISAHDGTWRKKDFSY